MTKKEYLKKPIVKNFIKWMSDVIANDFTHEYEDKRRKKKWKCNNFKEAIFPRLNDNSEILSGYYWKGDFEKDDSILKGYSELLKESILKKNTLNCLIAIIKILDWGGVHKVIPDAAAFGLLFRQGQFNAEHSSAGTGRL